MSVTRALRRPLNYETMAPSEQWAADKTLGILDWDPTEEEGRRYVERRNLDLLRAKVIVKESS